MVEAISEGLRQAATPTFAFGAMVAVPVAIQLVMSTARRVRRNRIASRPA